MADVDVWVHRGSTFNPLLFLIYVNDLADGLLNAELFETDTSLFSVVYNVNTSADKANTDLVKFTKWAYQGKMSFNPDPIEKTQEVVFTRKISKEEHRPFFKQ